MQELTDLISELVKNYETHFKQVDKLVDEQNKKAILYVKLFNADFDDVIVSHNKELKTIILKYLNLFMQRNGLTAEVRTALTKASDDTREKFKLEAHKKLNAVFNDFNDRGGTRY